ncbi:MAG: hypothetical protein ACRD03_15145 [Acidimicrobiales bacterium]
MEAAVEAALTAVLPVNLGRQPRLVRAVMAQRLAAAATRLSRAEVMAARDHDGATWDDVAQAFDITRQAAHERFRTGPDGLHSRYFKRHGPT